MAAPDEANDVYATLLEVNAWAMRAGLYEVAYHALAAALHLAESLADPKRFDTVAALAERQQEHIDEHEPGHRLSRRSSEGRGQAGLFPTLARQARLRATLARTPRA
ncbi:MAG TPA: hypothetical protein VFS43_04125 [Polyangiaceae bacterium]|nr:hypothetical protein [Polyangiaceae bacterium]